METIIKSFEEMDFTKDTNREVYIDDVSVTYCQDGDCTENRDDVQTLTVSARNNGVARFLNLKTDNWSIDGIGELSEIIEDFKKRAGITDEEFNYGKE